MEDGLSPFIAESTEEIKKNGVDVSIMANPLAEDEKNVSINVNGNVDDHNLNPDDYSSESDALVIDESVPVRKKKRAKIISEPTTTKKKSSDELVHFNPYFNESLFELSQQHHHQQQTNNVNSSHVEDVVASPPPPPPTTTTTSQQQKNNTQNIENNSSCSSSGGSISSKRPKSKNNNPKLREYAQYLGLQPTVQFKCWRCGRAGFESLTTLNDHVVQCTDEPPAQPPTSDNSLSTFKLTRKVFLCSACGTYYENWNLYLHMIEVHRRYLCLYCLGMFSVLDDLCLHIQSRHNLEPGHKDSIDDFFSAYRDPCYIVCCECNKLFSSEQDDFFYHICTRKGEQPPSHNNNNNNNNRINQSKTTAQINNKLLSKVAKQILRPEDHVTGDSTTIITNGGQVPEALLSTGSVTAQSDDIPPVIDEIIYSSEDDDNELNFTGFDESGQAIFLDVKNTTTTTTTKTSTTPPAIEENVVDKDNDDDEGGIGEEEAEEEDEEEGFEEEEEEEEEYYEEENNQSNPLDLNTAMDVDEEPKKMNVEKDENEEMEQVVETRKVPKLSLKLKLGSFPQITSEDINGTAHDQSQQHEPQSDNENETNTIESEEKTEEEPVEVAEQPQQQQQHEMKIAGQDIAIIELELEQPLDKFDIRLLLQKCLRATAPFCIYCNHARKIAVNGKQLGLHAIAEHRFSAVVSSITAEELIPESFVTRITDSLPELDSVFFSLESSASDEAITFSHQFECFQCRYSTNVHKELYLHNRKMHAKNLLLCIMCKSNFYSYSELICHMCPGVYILDYDVTFRCCMCVGDELPSAFRLMVHLRKRHHVCDVCLEMCHNQYKLSNHVWKHKLHHFCYRCGIAYRNKPDITRHLFWKHGTESVLCKKCLQKKWPHVYHFCVPPTSFLCDECNLSFGRAVSLKVHKRIHADEKPHACTVVDDCGEAFVSKKLLAKHERQHREPPPAVLNELDNKEQQQQQQQQSKQPADDVVDVDGIKTDPANTTEITDAKVEEKVKPKVDVYDLPALNLSESDSSSDSEDDEIKKKKKEMIADQPQVSGSDVVVMEPVEEEMLETINKVEQVEEENGEQQQQEIVLENIWDNFKTYQANKEKFDHLLIEADNKSDGQDKSAELPSPINDEPLTVEIALRDHDYCIDPENKPDISFTEVKPDLSQSVDHDYCSFTTTKENNQSSETAAAAAAKQEQTTSQRKTEANNNSSSTSDSSSDSDSSSCSCGPNCSCSSSSGSSSSSSESSDSDSSTEEGRKRQQIRRDRRRQKKQQKTTTVSDDKQQQQQLINVAATQPAQQATVVVPEMPIHESDLDTTETDTDEEFYDKQPQKLAKKMLEEKRNQLLAGIQTPNGTNSRAATPNLPDIEEEQQQQQSKQKKKSKSKKKKKRKSERKGSEEHRLYKNNLYMQQQQQQQDDVQQKMNYYSYYQQPTVAPITLVRNSPVPSTNKHHSLAAIKNVDVDSSPNDNDQSLRASKRRRVPNRFYGYSSDEEDEKAMSTPPVKWRKSEPAATTQLVVPPITIKTTPTLVPPIRLATSTAATTTTPRLPPIKLKPPPLPAKVDVEAESDEAESNDSSNEGRHMLQVNPDALYCYCKCPYDEVSEMIGCDSRDCSIEWFHFECVGIMVPPKGHWYCPECRKKRQQKRDMLKLENKMRTT